MTSGHSTPLAPDDSSDEEFAPPPELNQPSTQPAPQLKERDPDRGWDSNSDSDSDADPDVNAHKGLGRQTRLKHKEAPVAQSVDLEVDEAADLATEAGDVAAYGRGKRRPESKNNRLTSLAGGQGQESDAKWAERTRQADAIWEEMKSSANVKFGESDAGVSPTSPQAPTQRTVRIQRTYRFAGNNIQQDVEVPADHPEALAQQRKPTGSTSVRAPHATHTQNSPDKSASTREALPPASQSNPSLNTSNFSGEPSSQPPYLSQKPRPLSGARKRKPGSSLASLAAAAKAKPTKLNTVEKSKMDWEAFKSRSLAAQPGVNSQSDDGDQGVPQRPDSGLTRAEVEEMEAQTHGGARGLGNMQGYLDRSDFLARVHARQEEHLSRK